MIRSLRKKDPSFKRIAVGLSGGVDSSAALAILKSKGHDLVAITFKMWPKEECGASYGRSCCSLEAITRARSVTESLGVPYYVLDFSAEFKERVIDYFCDAYLKGMTPNPCVVCNEKIKFGLLLEKAKQLEAYTIATGHYARAGFDRKTGRFLLKEGKDPAKDQSYFLFKLSQDQLGRALFPVGSFTKEKVRRIARKFKLKTYRAASSQDICFIRDLDYAAYIKKKTGVKIQEGDIIDSSGKVLGRHKGIVYYTIGQRKGLGISSGAPLYVTGIDIGTNRIIVGTKKDVLKKGLIAGDLNWISIEALKEPIKVKARIRYNHPKAAATVTPMGPDMVRVEFDEPQEAPTPGQAVVFYDKDVVVGGGWIREA